MTSPTPPRLPIPAGRQLTLRLVQGGQEAAVVLGFVGAGEVDAENRAAALRDIAWLAFRPLMAGDVSIVGAVLRDVSQADGKSVEVGAPSTTATNSGGAGGSSLVAAACYLLRWSTATGGRTGKGRTYLPGVVSTAVNAGGRTYTAGYQGTAATAITQYLAPAQYNAVATVPAVLSFTRGAARPITGGALAPVVGIQRRRMR